jgi:hypothetical protein
LKSFIEAHEYAQHKIHSLIGINEEEEAEAEAEAAQSTMITY